MDRFFRDIFCWCQEDTRMEADESRRSEFMGSGFKTSKSRADNQRSFVLHHRSHSESDVYSELYDFVKNHQNSRDDDGDEEQEQDREQEQEQEQEQAFLSSEPAADKSVALNRNAKIDRVLKKGMQALEDVRRMKKEQLLALAALRDPHMVKGEEMRHLEASKRTLSAEARIRRHSVFRQKHQNKQSDLKNRHQGSNVDVRCLPAPLVRAHSLLLSVGLYKDTKIKEDAEVSSSIVAVSSPALSSPFPPLAPSLPRSLTRSLTPSLTPSPLPPSLVSPPSLLFPSFLLHDLFTSHQPPVNGSLDSKLPRLCKVGCQCMACEHEVQGYLKVKESLYPSLPLVSANSCFDVLPPPLLSLP
eukprot:765242-Hanusia_phi.AAC.1